jgi:hypothetical protein
VLVLVAEGALVSRDDASAVVEYGAGASEGRFENEGTKGVEETDAGAPEALNPCMAGLHWLPPPV